MHCPPPSSYYDWYTAIHLFLNFNLYYMKPKKFDLYETITKTIIEMLGDHLESWDKPWVMIDQEGLGAHNAQSRKAYKGLNQMLLSMIAVNKGYAKNSWLTFNQVRELGGSVLKGEKSATVIFWKFTYFDQNGKVISTTEAEKLNEKQLMDRKIAKKPLLRYFSVFNVFQTQGLDEKFYHIEIANLPGEFEKDERAEKLIQSTDAKVIYIADRACYNSATDVISLPLRDQFKSTEVFYETALHELGHWTGHSSRLNRKLGNEFGSKDYAFEELVAELTSSFLCADLGFTKMITHNASYIKSWIKILKDDHNFIFKASSQAEKASKFITNFGQYSD
jgi:antirestriction protein ArdC